ncbi:MAG: hypothetical protein ACYTDT_07600 [Planctomycetota bacterium]
MPESFAPEVDMDAGAEVVFKQTDSQRRASVDPTRVFVKQRETGLTTPAEVKSEGGGKGLIIAAVLVLVIGGGAAAFFLLGGNPPTNTPVATSNNNSDETNDPDTPADKPLREKLLEESNTDGVTVVRLLAILKEAEKAKLELDVRKTLSSRAVAKVVSEKGGKASNGDLFELSDNLEHDGDQSGADQICRVIVDREKATLPPTEDMIKAQGKLGLVFLDFDAIELVLNEVFEWKAALEIVDVKERFDSLKEKAKGNWIGKAHAGKVEAIQEEILAAKERLDKLQKDNPYLLIAAPIIADFRKTRLGKTKSWRLHTMEPIICIAEASIDEFSAEDLLTKFVEIHDFYMANVVEPLGLKRLQPAHIEDQTERENAPFIVFMFDDRKSWGKYLQENTSSSADASRIIWFTEFDNGRFSCFHDGGDQSEANSKVGFHYLMVDYYHPRVPTERVTGGNMTDRFAHYIFNEGIDCTNADEKRIPAFRVVRHERDELRWASVYPETTRNRKERRRTSRARI